MSGEPIKIITAGGYTFAKFCKAGSKSKINTEMVNTISYTIVLWIILHSHSNSPLESCGARDLSSLLYLRLIWQWHRSCYALAFPSYFIIVLAYSQYSPCRCPNIDNRESFPVVSSVILTRESCTVFAQVKDHVLFRGVRFTLDCKQIRFKCQNYTWKQGLTYTWYQIPT